MPRSPRHFYPGATYHVMLRGNNGQPIFLSDEERQRFCLLLQQGTERFRHRIIAFCFMTNHVHLAVQVAEAPLSQICHNLAFRYTQFHNRRHDRVGHLFQGRFKSVLVDGDNYLRGLIRYIHLNPVRAGLADHAEEYRWSSHRAYLAKDSYTWLSHEIGLERFHSRRPCAVKAFEAFVRRDVCDEEDIDFDRGMASGVVGDDRFIETLGDLCRGARRSKSRVEVDFQLLLDHVTTHHQICAETLPTSNRDARTCRARAMLALLAKKTEGVSLTDVSNYLGQDLSSVSRAASRLEVKQLNSPELASEIESLLDRVGRAGLSSCQA